MSADDGFQSLRLRRELIREIDGFVQSERAKKLGYKNRAEFVDRAVRDKLIETRADMKHVYVLADHVKIVDFALKLIVSVYFKEEGTVWCDYDHTDNCPHVDYALQLPEVKEALEKRRICRKVQDEDGVPKT